jgi:membrane associated rhomboid family serine protease
MGIEDRSYYRDSYESSNWLGGGGGRSVVVTLIIINTVIWVISLFTPARIDKQALEQFRKNDTDGNGQIDINSEVANEDLKTFVAADKNRDGAVQQQEFTNFFGMRGLTYYMAANTDIIKQPWNAWKLLTYGFAHDGRSIMHLLFNMLALFFLGRAVEMKLGSEEFLKFYLFAIVFSGFGWLLFNLIRGVPSSAVGASGAVSAVIGLFIFCFPKQKVLLYFAIPIPAWVLGVLIIVIDFFSAINSQSRVAGEAHLAGFGFAALYFFLGWNFQWLKWDWFKSIFKRKPSLKVHDPHRGIEKLKEQADEILQKVHEQGEQSLTRRERKILEKYSRSVRKAKSNRG